MVRVVIAGVAKGLRGLGFESPGGRELEVNIASSCRRGEGEGEDLGDGWTIPVFVRGSGDVSTVSIRDTA